MPSQSQPQTILASPTTSTIWTTPQQAHPQILKREKAQQLTASGNSSIQSSPSSAPAFSIQDAYCLASSLWSNKFSFQEPMSEPYILSDDQLSDTCNMRVWPELHYQCNVLAISSYHGSDKDQILLQDRVDDPVLLNSELRACWRLAKKVWKRNNEGEKVAVFGRLWVSLVSILPSSQQTAETGSRNNIRFVRVGWTVEAYAAYCNLMGRGTPEGLTVYIEVMPTVLPKIWIVSDWVGLWMRSDVKRIVTLMEKELELTIHHPHDRCSSTFVEFL